MNIVLLGYRGTGKSEVAVILSKKLQREVFNTDRIIVEKAGMTIPEIVEKWGWGRFREMESEVVEKVAAQAATGVIDCGGGVVLNDNNIQRLKRKGKTVLLKADIETILKRIREDKNRPPLKEGMSFEEEQRKVLAEREEKYHAAADFECDTTTKSPDETAAAIIEYFRAQNWI